MKWAFALSALLTLLAMPVSAAEDLHAAAAAGDVAAIERLLSTGAAIDAKDGRGQTALLVAVAEGQTVAALALIAAGASVNVQADNRDTPWLLAGAEGHAKVLRAMIPAGPDLTIRNRYGGNALIPACERGHVEAIEVLLTSGIDVNHVNDLGWTCLLEIVILGDGGPAHQEAARLVLAAGADPDLADGEGVTPLAHARAQGQDNIAALISAAGGG